MEAVLKAMSLPRKLWDGTSKSLIELGYRRIGIDECAVRILCLPSGCGDAAPACEQLVLILCRGWSLRSTRRGWEECAGVRGPKGKPTYHDAHGSPIINNSTFPDMKGLVKATADAGGVLDWYLNNCGPCPSVAPGHIAQDVAAWDALGFGGTKVDGCDVAKNISEWYQALLQTGKPFLLVRTPQTLPRHLKCNATPGC